MKPLHLRMCAFGPYVGEQVIDFKPVCERELFLIHGPTGGGKTTILDAICFALYGKTSGDRTGEQMRSQTASANVATEVQLRFAIGSREYNVIRRPKQLLVGRGGKPREQPPKATLFQVVDGIERPLAEGANDVTAKVQELLGFSVQQFCQVIMLPQGKFRDLLLAGSAERERILETLFGTSYYEQLQKAIGEAAKEARKRLDAQHERSKALLTEAGVESAEALEQKLADTVAKLAEQKGQTTALEQAAREAQERLNAGRSAAEKLDVLRKAETRVRQAELRRREITEGEQAIARAQRAQQVAPAEQQYRGRAKEVPAREKALEQARQQERAAADRAERAAVRRKLAEAGAEAANEHRQQLGRVRALEGRIARLAEAESSLAGKQGALQQAQEAQQKLRAESESASEQRKGLTDRLASVRELAARADGLRQAAERVHQLLRDRKALDDLVPQIEQARRDLERGQRADEKAEAALLEAKERQRVLLVAWVNSSAARLATELRAGEPCPVCGSREHPAPAGAAGEMPSQEQLDAAQKAVDNADWARTAAAKRLSDCREMLSRQEEAARLRREELGDEGRGAEELAEQYRAAKAEFDKATKAQQAMPGLQEQLTQVEAAIKELEEKLKAADEQVARARDVATAARTTRDECIADLPEQLLTHKAWESELARLQTLVDAAAKELEEARKAATDAESAAAVAREALRQAGEELEQAKRAASEARAAFMAALHEQEFASEHDYAAARLTTQQIEQKREQIKLLQREIQEAQGALVQAQQSAAGLEPPDIAMLESRWKSADVAHKDAMRLESELEAQRKALMRLEGRIREVDEQIAKLTEEDQVLWKLSESAAGSNPQRLTFHRFVLGSLLDEVLYAASQRLRMMSRGRYRLDRVRDVVDRRVSGGLDLEVFDAYSGQSRPVATLSGGESFQASLALSLGLADAVQNRAGGIHMETMFIDEGFGSLDAEALDEAMNAIRDLQRGGRVVGIISHVPELRQVVRARIEIASGAKGSEARVHCL